MIGPDDEEPEVREGPRDSPPKGRRSFTSVRRDLSEDELGSPAVQKLLLDELDRLEGEVVASRGIRERFHQADKRASILEEKFKTYSAHEILSNACLAAGSAMLGYAPSAWSTVAAAPIVLAAGVILIAGALWAKSEKL